ncbi:hypothetical protein SAMN05880571_1792 [Bacillus velezensis]|nr:hypothetical protein SAMN05880571_1792 [Bacillus velezensis]
MFTVFEIGPWVIEADAEETRKQDCLRSLGFVRLSVTIWGSMERKTACIIMRAAIRLSAGLGKAGRIFISRGREISAFRFHCRVQHFLYRRVFLTLLSISTFHSCSRGCLRKTRIKARRAMHRAQSFLPSHLSHHFLRGASLRAGACSFSFLEGSGP